MKRGYRYFLRKSEKTSQFSWLLRASNGKIVASSGETYVHKRSCLKNLELFRQHAPKAPINDRTDPNAPPRIADYEFEVYRDTRGETRWRIQAPNNVIIATSGEGYSSKRSAFDAIDLVKAHAALAEIVDQTTLVKLGQPPIVSFTFTPAAGAPPLLVALDASESSAPDGTITAFEWDFGDGESGTGVIVMHTYLNVGTFSVILTVTDDTGNTSSTSHTLSVSSKALPSDPSSVAPAVDQSVATVLVAATEFLYTGSNPIQTGVAEGTIEPRRVAVLRGQVLTREGQPLSGVKISALGHPEFGTTSTRADGMFDMAVNGGGQITVRYEKDAHFLAQRQITVPWQEYVWLPDVVMVRADAQVSPIALNADIAMQVARGSRVSDDGGDRQATLLFPQGTTAEMVLPDGTTQPLENLQVRATEFTVGPNGPGAMPGELPANSGYTYAVEFTADEALEAGANEVRFSQPLIHYVENFINFPVGTIVPVGSYDRDRAVWLPSNNGRVVRMLAINNGLADLDIDGTDQAADAAALAELGVTEAERRQVGTLYQPGQSLWRLPIDHFSPWDCNWPYGAPPDAEGPGQSDPERDDLEDESCETEGSIIDIQNQVLGEVLGVPGTSFSLHHRSDRVPGRLAAATLGIPLSGKDVPGSLKRIELEIFVAGQRFTQSFPAAPDQRHTFTWDGRDAYGRPVQGAQRVRIRLRYFYDSVYMEPSQVEESFAQFTASGVAIEGVEGRQEFALTQEMTTTTAGILDARARGLGGWSSSVHHAYDPTGRTVYFGDGRRRSARSLNIDKIITTVVGMGPAPADSTGFVGDGGQATEAQLFVPRGLAIDSEGSLYIADSQNHRIRRVAPDGIITTVAGIGTPGFSGDGGPATKADLGFPNAVAVGPDSSLYVSTSTIFMVAGTATPGFSDAHRVRRVGPDGIITTVAGTGAPGFSGDGGPATQAQLGNPLGMAVGPDGSLYIADSQNHQIRRVGPDGIITTVAGRVVLLPEVFSPLGDGDMATKATLSFPTAIAVGSDGSLYIADNGHHRIRRVGPDGIIITAAGISAPVAGLATGGFSGDGGPATSAQIDSPTGVALGPDGTLYIAEGISNARVRRVGTDGIITTVAGTGTDGFSGDGGPATSAQIGRINQGIAVGPDGSLYLSVSADLGPSAIFEGGSHRVRRVASPLPGFTGTAFEIVSADASQLYAFDGRGRHLATANTLTGALLYRFEYDANGQLEAIRDGDQNVTAVERDTNGDPTAIIGPFGHRTELALNGDGYVERIANSAGHTIKLTYNGAGGLLANLADPRGNVYRFFYDDLGRLTREEDPAGGFKDLVRTQTANGFEVQLITKPLRETSYRLERLPTGEKLRENACCSGIKTGVQTGTEGAYAVTHPNGTVIKTELNPDPRWGMQAPFVRVQTTTTPGGLTATITKELTAELANPDDPLTLQRLIKTTTINGRAFVDIFEADSLKLTSRTPLGRLNTTTLDGQGRVIETQIPGLLPIQLSYNARGQLEAITQGSNSFTFGYDDRGNLISTTDPLSRSTHFRYDELGRLIKQISPDNRETAFAYDEAGNMTSLTPPERPSYKSAYTKVNLEEQQIRPDVGAGNDVTQFVYNLDQQLERVTLPDGQTISLRFDDAGRLRSTTTPRGQTDLTHDADTGNLITIRAPDDGTVQYEYDGLLHTAIILAGTISGSVRRTYNSDALLSSQRINEGQPINFGYDDDGLLIQAGALSLTLDPQSGLLTGTELGNVTTIRTYNDFGELKTYQAEANGVELLAVGYLRDALGRIERMTETVDGQKRALVYDYDDAGRLGEIRQDGVLKSQFTYDANGNRVNHTMPNGTETGTYDDQDRLLTYSSKEYSYAVTGALRRKTDTVINEATNYDYDALDNLMAVTLPSGTQIEYLVDGVGRRIGKKVNGRLIQGFLYQDNLNPVAELDGTDRVVSRFIFATDESVPDFMIKDDVTFRVIADHLGSVRLVVNVQTGEIAQRMDYDTFGNVIQDTNPGFQPFGFAGGLYDLDTGLVRFGARDYDSEVGRWTAKDPIEFVGGDTNLYVYVENNPVNFTDPSGQFIPIVAGLFIGAGLEFGMQMLENGGELDCVNWGKVGLFGGLGALGGLFTGGRVFSNAFFRRGGSLLTKDRVKYGLRNLVWDNRTSAAVRSQYWGISGGARASGNTQLGHLWAMNSSHWVPNGFRQAGLNLMELRAGVNHWAGGRLGRELAISAAVFGQGAGAGNLGYRGGSQISSSGSDSGCGCGN